VTNYIKVRRVIVYYSTPYFSLSRWRSKQGQSPSHVTQTTGESVLQSAIHVVVIQVLGSLILI